MCRTLSDGGGALPLVSIITVVFNGEEFIERTIKSVLGQDYPNIEYIVIDGGSVDGTVDLIGNYQSKIAHFSSEPDRGIYDAMNKGLAISKGRWINFMNAGDSFFAKNTISEVMGRIDEGCVIAYGGVEIQYPEFSRIELPGAPSRLWRGMQFSHQSVFFDGDYHRKNVYNICNPIAADLELIYKAYKDSVEFKNIEMVVSRVITGGVSEKRRLRAIQSTCEAVCGKDFHPFLRIYFWGRKLDAICRAVAKCILPEAVVRLIILSK